MSPNQFILSADLNAFGEYNVLSAYTGTQQVLSLTSSYIMNRCTTCNTITLATSILI